MNNPYSSISQLTDEQRTEVVALFDDPFFDYTRIAAFIREHFRVKISRSAVARFYHSIAVKDVLAETPDTAAAAREIIHFAATNQPKFSESTIHVLEKTAFELSFLCHLQHKHLEDLARITQILARCRNAAVRERLAAVQETKCDLRREEINLRREQLDLRNARLRSLPPKPLPSDS